MTLPASWAQIPVTGTYANLDGSPAQGRIYFNSAQVVTIDGVTIIPMTQYVDLVNGAIPAGFTLPSTNDPGLNLTGWAYTVIEGIKHSRSTYAIFVPYDSAGIDMATVAPVVTPAALVSVEAAAVVAGAQAAANAAAAQAGIATTQASTATTQAGIATTQAGLAAGAVTEGLTTALGNPDGFQQAGTESALRTVQDKAREYRVSSADYKKAGVTDAQAIALAFADLLVRPTGGELLISGNVALDAAVVLDCAQSPTGTPTAAQQAWRLKVTCNGSITPASGIGNAIKIINAICPDVQLNFQGGGGGTSDSAFAMNVTRGGHIRLTGENYDGVLWHYDNTGAMVELHGGTVYSNKCRQALDWQGGSSGFGTIDTVWDIYSTNGSLVKSITDLSIKHFEATAPTGRTDPNLTIYSCGSAHFGVIALGMAGNQLLNIQNSDLVTIDDVYLYGGGLNTVDGVLIIDSSVHFGKITAFSVNNAVLVDGGADISIAAFSGKNNTCDFLLRKLASTSTAANVRVGSYYSLTPVTGFVNSNSSILTGAFTVAAGATVGGNTGGATAYGVNINCSAAFSANFNNVIMGAGTVAFTKSFRTVYQQSSNCSSCSFAEGGLAGSAILSSDGRAQSVPLAASPLVFGTTYANTFGQAVQYTVPVTFNNPAGNSYAAVQLQDPAGTVFDLIDRHDKPPTPGTPIAVLRFIVPAGWSFQIKRSATADVSLTGTARAVTV